MGKGKVTLRPIAAEHQQKMLTKRVNSFLLRITLRALPVMDAFDPPTLSLYYATKAKLWELAGRLYSHIWLNDNGRSPVSGILLMRTYNVTLTIF